MKNLISIAATMLGFSLLAGCRPIPMFNIVIRGKDVTNMVGPANSNRPIRVGSTTMDQVIQALGQPRYVGPTDRDIAYTWSVLNSVTVLPYPWGGSMCSVADYGRRALILSFDSQNVLSNYLRMHDDGFCDLDSKHELERYPAIGKYSWRNWRWIDPETRFQTPPPEPLLPTTLERPP